MLANADALTSGKQILYFTIHAQCNKRLVEHARMSNTNGSQFRNMFMNAAIWPGGGGGGGGGGH